MMGYLQKWLGGVSVFLAGTRHPTRTKVAEERDKERDDTTIFWPASGSTEATSVPQTETQREESELEAEGKGL